MLDPVLIQRIRAIFLHHEPRVTIGDAAGIARVVARGDERGHSRTGRSRSSRPAAGRGSSCASWRGTRSSSGR